VDSLSGMSHLSGILVEIRKVPVATGEGAPGDRARA